MVKIMKLNLYNVKNIKDDESIGRCDFKDILLDGLILEDIRNENYPNLKKWLRYQLFQRKDIKKIRCYFKIRMVQRRC